MSTEESTHSWRRSLAPLLKGGILTLVISLASGPVLARGLGVEDRGHYQLLILLYFLLPEVIGLTQPTAIASLPTERPIRLGYAITYCFVAWIPALAVLAAVAQWGGSEGNEFGLAILAIAFPAMMFVQLLKGLLQRDKLFGALATTRFIDISGSSLLAILLFAVGQLSLRTAALTLTIPTLIACIYGIARLRQIAPLSWKFPTEWTAISKLGFKLHGSRLVYLCVTYAAQIFVTITMTTEALGIFSVAIAIAALGLVVPAILQQIATPVVAQARSAGATTEPAGLGRTVRLTFLLSLFMVAGYALCAPFLVPLLFGEEYRAGWLPSVILLAANCITGVSLVVDGALSGAHKAKEILYARIASALVLVALLFSLGRNGLVATSLCALVSSVVSVVLLLRSAKTTFEGRHFLNPRLILKDLVGIRSLIR